MTDNLTIAEVEKIAALSRLDLTEDEKALYATQLARILDYARQVAELDTRDTAPTASVDVEHPRERADVPHPCLAPGAALGNAPDAAGGLFRVPKVLGDA